jgi:transposase
MRIISMKQTREVLRLHLLASLSSRKIKSATGVARTTVQDYIRRCDASDITAKSLQSLNDDELSIKLFGEPKHAAPRLGKVMPDYNIIHQELKQSKKDKTKVTLMFLWEAYKEQYGSDAYEYTQFRVYYRRYKQKLNPSMRQIHIAGEKLFVDYSGVTLPIYDQKSGEIEYAQVFVAVLGASGYTFVHVTPSQKKEDFILSHVLAYEFFGGTPEAVVPDNLKSAITFNDKKHGLVVNESYAALARHFQMRVEPARPRKPKDKPLAEQGVQAIQRYILAHFRHQKIFSVDEANDKISAILDKYNNKMMKHIGKSRTQLFEELDKPELRPLPANRYVYEQFKIARVNMDYHITLEKCNYSVPFKYLKDEVEVRYSTQHVRIYFKNEIIATHPRLRTPGETSTLHEHMPNDHQYIHEKMNPQRLRSWAKSIGQYSAVFVEDAFEAVEHKANAYRQIVAVLSLAKRYGATELELALMYAAQHRILRVKSIISILDKKLYLQKSANNESYKVPTLFDTHENLRGPDTYK